MSHYTEALDRLHTILDWLIHVQDRHPDSLKFGIVHVCFHDPAKLGNAYGAPEAAHLLDGLLDAMQKAFRKTDIIARDGTDFWLLVPYTSPDTVVEKAQRLVEIASENGLNIVDRDIAVFSLPDPEFIRDIGGAGSPAEFLAHLKKHRGIAFHWGARTQS